MVNDEASIIVRRINVQLASEAITLKAAAGAVMTEEGGKHFNELIEGLLGDEAGGDS